MGVGAIGWMYATAAGVAEELLDNPATLAVIAHPGVEAPTHVIRHATALTAAVLAGHDVCVVQGCRIYG